MPLPRTEPTYMKTPSRNRMLFRRKRDSSAISITSYDRSYRAWSFSRSHDVMELFAFLSHIAQSSIDYVIERVLLEATIGFSFSSRNPGENFDPFFDSSG